MVLLSAAIILAALDLLAADPGRRVRPPFDPVRDNGPIFVGWPTPQLAIVITGRQDGYLEPCGCAGLDRMRGGLSRRQTMIESLRERGWPLVLLDAGGLSGRFGPQALLKLRFTVEALSAMGYEAIGWGTADLRFAAADLVALVTSEEGRSPRFLSANVSLFGSAAHVTPQSGTVTAGGLRLGVTSVLGKKYQLEINNPDVEVTDPEAALAAVVPELRRACDYLILLSHATKDESVAIARRFPDFDLVVTVGGRPVPPTEPERIEGSPTLLIEVGEKVKDAIVVGLFADSNSLEQRPERSGQSPKLRRDWPWRYQRVPIDSRFAPAAAMKERMVEYQEELRQLGLEGLGLRPQPHPRQRVQGGFVGSEECADCHEVAFESWDSSQHAQATQTLVALDPPRQFDPECLACHTTGWHPQGGFPYESGYESLQATPLLAGVGCESCHGPGDAHVKAEHGDDEALQKKLRAAIALTEAQARRETCPSCHDVNNSPDFAFEAYWPDVAHDEEPRKQ